MRNVCVALSLWAASCASAPPPRPAAPAPATPPPPPVEVPVAKAEPPASDRHVEVKGLEGTLQAYDVRDAMNRKLDDLAACQQRRIRHVRKLEGSIELAIHVLTDGSVSQVDVIASDLGDRATEECIAQVTRETNFAEPHGGEADVKWNVTLDPHRTRAAEQYESARFEEALELNLPDLAETCEMTRRSPALQLTAYVAPSGKVMAAGAASQVGTEPALLACATEHARGWRLPPPRGGVSKARFEVRYRPPLNDKQRDAIRKRHARKRKAERAKQRAEARRKAQQKKAEARRRARQRQQARNKS